MSCNSLKFSFYYLAWVLVPLPHPGLYNLLVLYNDVYLLWESSASPRCYRQRPWLTMRPQKPGKSEDLIISDGQRRNTVSPAYPVLRLKKGTTPGTAVYGRVTMWK